MSDIGPEDLVEAIRSRDDGGVFGLQPLIGGAIYKVKALNRNTKACLDCGSHSGFSIQLYGDNPAPGLPGWSVAGWCTCDLRPMRRPPSATIIETLKRPVCEPVKEDA